ncbi:hypothetical protein ACPXBB_26330, partial [Escherichia coli]|uniref:hypothetical protein n=1 Tax=Escherichia coli TaxID=562 RepID=UPI003CEFBE6A
QNLVGLQLSVQLPQAWLQPVCQLTLLTELLHQTQLSSRLTLPHVHHSWAHWLDMVALSLTSKLDLMLTH